MSCKCKIVTVPGNVDLTTTGGKGVQIAVPTTAGCDRRGHRGWCNCHRLRGKHAPRACGKAAEAGR